MNMYGPLGELIRATGPMAKLNPFRFSTKFTDDETGLLYYGNRYCNPSTGRWLSRDPIAEVAGPNVYAAILNDFNDYIDPIGLCATCKCKQLHLNPDPQDGPILPTTYSFTPQMGNPQEKFGYGVQVTWDVDGWEGACEYKTIETGHVSGGGPAGPAQSYNPKGKEYDVPRSWIDGMGIPVSLNGTYSLEGSLTVTYKCIDDDKTTFMSQTRTWNMTGNGKYPPPMQGPPAPQKPK